MTVRILLFVLIFQYVIYINYVIDDTLSPPYLYVVKLEYKSTKYTAFYNFNE